MHLTKIFVMLSKLFYLSVRAVKVSEKQFYLKIVLIIKKKKAMLIVNTGQRNSTNIDILILTAVNCIIFSYKSHAII